MQYAEGTYDSPSVVVFRSMSMLDKSGYNVFNNNCEHFAHWCKTGRKVSEQTNNAIKLGSRLLGGFVGGLATGAALPLATPGVIGLGIACVVGFVAGKLGEDTTQMFIDSPNYNYED